MQNTAARTPNGCEIAVGETCLHLDGRPWLPVMGEFHFSRCPAAEWRDELLKMRSGGVDIVSTCVFWIHHEEIQGTFDFSERRSLREFVNACAAAGLMVMARIGPWCHGEVRNGGFPDWLIQTGAALRSSDPVYLSHVTRLYTQIAGQLKGLLWKDGGPVIGVQIEHEFAGPAEHLITPKRIAEKAGLQVPLYTRTGWPALTTPMPYGELIPLHSAHADGFRDRALTRMPGEFWKAFRFDSARSAASATPEKSAVEHEADLARYPYLTCEIGGGMASSYHRRIRIDPLDIAAIALVKLGSGSNLCGYYMFHGGSNPAGERTALQESQETGYPNDLPVKSYDFQAPLGEFGQSRRHYHLLRRLHLFLRDFGSQLALTTAVIPPDGPTQPDDAKPLRWSVRTDGRSGCIFVNNYQRLLRMGPKPKVQFGVTAGDTDIRIPEERFTVPENSSFFFAFHLDLGGARLIHATAQPMCTLVHGDVTYAVFARIEGVPNEFVFDAATASVTLVNGTVSTSAGKICVRDAAAGNDVAIELQTKTGRLRVILLEEADSLTCYKLRFAGRERFLMTRSQVLADNDELRLIATDASDLSIAMIPPPQAMIVSGKTMPAVRDGAFARYTPPAEDLSPPELRIDPVKLPALPPPVRLGSAGVASPPTDDEFAAAAAIFRVRFDDVSPTRDLLMRIRYIGDILRIYLDGRLIADDFYNGSPVEIGLKRFAPDLYLGEFEIHILPLRKDAPIYLAEDAWPDFAGEESLARLIGVELNERHEVRLSGAAAT